MQTSRENLEETWTLPWGEVLLLERLWSDLVGIQPSFYSPWSCALAGTQSSQVMEHEGPLSICPWSATAIPTECLHLQRTLSRSEAWGQQGHGRWWCAYFLGQVVWPFQIFYFLAVEIWAIYELICPCFLTCNVEFMVPMSKKARIQWVNSLKAFKTVLSVWQIFNRF